MIIAKEISQNGFFPTILVILYIRFQGDTERRDKKQVTLKRLIEGLEKLWLLRKACETLRGIEISKKKKYRSCKLMKPQEKSEALFRPSKERFRMVTLTRKANLGSQCIILENS